MKSFLLLLLLRLGSGPSSGVFAETAESSPLLPPAFASVTAGEFSEDGSDGELAAWMPETALRVELDGSQVSGSSPDLTETPIRSTLPGIGARLFENDRAQGPVWQSAIRTLLEPLDLLSRWENVQMAWEKGFADLSVTTSFPDWIESWGACALGSRSALSLTLDMLGFDEFEGSDPLILDPRHATARLGYLSTAISFSLKF